MRFGDRLIEWVDSTSSHFSSPNRHVIYVYNNNIVRSLPHRSLPRRSLPREVQEATNYKNCAVRTLELWICRERYGDQDALHNSHTLRKQRWGLEERVQGLRLHWGFVLRHSFRLNTGTRRVWKAPTICKCSTIWRCYTHQISLIFGHVTSLYVYYQLNAQINWGMAFLKFIKSTYPILRVRHWIWQGGALIFLWIIHRIIYGDK